MDPLNTGHKTIKLVYIFGRGHSGSTILDLCVSRALNAFSGGEIISGLRRVSDSGHCACGHYSHECHIWGDIHEKLEYNGFSVKDFVSRNFSFVNFFKFSKNLTKIFEFDILLVSEIAKKIDNLVVVDSSKELYRAYCLSLNKDIDVDFIFITRNGLSVLSSYRSRLSKHGTINILRKKRKIPNIALSLASAVVLPMLVFGGQTFAVGVYVFLKVRTNRRIRHINYDKLPEMKTDKDFNALKDLLSFDVSRSPVQPAYHPISGNQLIWQEDYEVVFRPSSLMDRKVSALDRIFYGVIALPHIVFRHFF